MKTSYRLMLLGLLLLVGAAALVIFAFTFLQDAPTPAKSRRAR